MIKQNRVRILYLVKAKDKFGFERYIPYRFEDIEKCKKDLQKEGFKQIKYIPYDKHTEETEKAETFLRACEKAENYEDAANWAKVLYNLQDAK